MHGAFPRWLRGLCTAVVPRASSAHSGTAHLHRRAACRRHALRPQPARHLGFGPGGHIVTAGTPQGVAWRSWWAQKAGWEQIAEHTMSQGRIPGPSPAHARHTGTMMCLTPLSPGSTACPGLEKHEPIAEVPAAGKLYPNTIKNSRAVIMSRAIVVSAPQDPQIADDHCGVHVCLQAPRPCE